MDSEALFGMIFGSPLFDTCEKRRHRETALHWHRSESWNLQHEFERSC